MKNYPNRDIIHHSGGGSTELTDKLRIELLEDRLATAKYEYEVKLLGAKYSFFIFGIVAGIILSVIVIFI